VSVGKLVQVSLLCSLYVKNLFYGIYWKNLSDLALGCDADLFGKKECTADLEV
jgi:hypothetical protein